MAQRWSMHGIQEPFGFGTIAPTDAHAHSSVIPSYGASGMTGRSWPVLIRRVARGDSLREDFFRGRVSKACC